MKDARNCRFFIMLLLVAGVVFFQSCDSKRDVGKESINNGKSKTATSASENQEQSPEITPVIDKKYQDILAKFEKSAPEKVISIAPSTTELLYEYGVGNLLIAAVEPHDYPKESKKLESVGNLTLNIEKIVLLKPDIIIGERNLFLGQLGSLQDLGFPLLLFDTRTPDDLWRDLSIFDRIFHRKKADELKSNTLQTIETYTKPAEKYRIACVISSTPLMLAGGKSYMSSLIELAGCQNVINESSGDYIVISREQMIAKDPEIIIYTYPGIREELQKKKALAAWKPSKQNVSFW